MCDLNCCRENVCGVSLRTACAIFGLLQLIFWTLLCIFIIHDKSIHSSFKATLVCLGLVLFVALFYGIIREQPKALWIYTGISLAVAGCLVCVLGLSLIVMIICGLTEVRNAGVGMFFSAAVGVLFFGGLLFVIIAGPILPVRNYQKQLQNRVVNRPMAEAVESGKLCQ